jgi:hypothetical protein
MIVYIKNVFYIFCKLINITNFTKINNLTFIIIIFKNFTSISMQALSREKWHFLNCVIDMADKYLTNKNELLHHDYLSKLKKGEIKLDSNQSYPKLNEILNKINKLCTDSELKKIINIMRREIGVAFPNDDQIILLDYLYYRYINNKDLEFKCLIGDITEDQKIYQMEISNKCLLKFLKTTKLTEERALQLLNNSIPQKKKKSKYLYLLILLVELKNEDVVSTQNPSSNASIYNPDDEISPSENKNKNKNSLQLMENQNSFQNLTSNTLTTNGIIISNMYDNDSDVLIGNINK